jgi:hypothetical protein
MGIVGLSGRDVVRLSTGARERAGAPGSTEAIGMNREGLGYSPSGSLEQVSVFGEVLLRESRKKARMCLHVAAKVEVG